MLTRVVTCGTFIVSDIERAVFMKNITVTYHMERENETAENCVTLSIDEEIAKRLSQGSQSGVARARLERAISCLAGLQGYLFVGICTIELD